MYDKIVIIIIKKRVDRFLKLIQKNKIQRQRHIVLTNGIRVRISINPSPWRNSRGAGSVVEQYKRIGTKGLYLPRSRVLPHFTGPLPMS